MQAARLHREGDAVTTRKEPIMYTRNAPLLDLGPVSSAVIVGVVLFVGMPLAGLVRWLLRY